VTQTVRADSFNTGELGQPAQQNPNRFAGQPLPRRTRASRSIQSDEQRAIVIATHFDPLGDRFLGLGGQR